MLTSLGHGTHVAGIIAAQDSVFVSIDTTGQIHTCLY